MRFKCYWSVYDNPHFCAYQAKKKEFQAFQALLDKADKENTHDIDKDYCCEGDYKEVDEKFFACPNHLKLLTCNDCEKLLTRHQIYNYLNSEDYNHNGDRHRNFGNPTDASCTACCIKYDYELRCEVGLDGPYCFECGEEGTADDLNAFHILLDKAEDNKCDFVEDVDYMGYNEDAEGNDLVDDKFYACKECISQITCAECDKLLRRHEINNFRNSNTHNHLNEGLCVGPAGCTKCDLRNEGYDVDTEEESDTETVSSKESAPKPSRNTVMASEIPLPPSPPPLNLYQEFYVQQHPGIKAANPTWTPQQITTEIGRRWSLQQMSISQTADDITVMHAKKKYKLDGCSKGTELRVYLEAYRAKHGHEALLKLVETLSA